MYSIHQFKYTSNFVRHITFERFYTDTKIPNTESTDFHLYCMEELLGNTIFLYESIYDHMTKISFMGGIYKRNIISIIFCIYPSTIICIILIIGKFTSFQLIPVLLSNM